MSKDQTKHSTGIAKLEFGDIIVGEKRIGKVFGYSGEVQSNIKDLTYKDPTTVRANGNFIVESFNVFHETGLTPSQLQQENKELKEQRDELLKLVGRFVAGIQLDGDVNEYSPVYSDARTYKDKTTSTK